MSKFDARFNIIMFGDLGSGKTSLLKRFISNSYDPNSRKSIGVVFEVKMIHIGNKNVKLYVWDFGGTSKFMLPSYARSAKGGLFMYDITNYFSLTHIDNWLRIIRKEKKSEEQFPIIMVGGKADLENEREVSAEEGMKIAKSKGMDGFIECSSKTGENVEKIFEALTRLMLVLQNLKD